MNSIDNHTYQNILDTVYICQNRLNKNYDYFIRSSESKHIEIAELFIQLDIFVYETAIIFINFYHLKPEGFAQKVFIKEMIHKLHSYELAYDSTISKRMRSLISRYQLPLDLKSKTPQRLDWLAKRKIIQKWSSIRNSATGHYESDISQQIRQIDTVNFDEVLNCCVSFLSYTMFIAESFVAAVPVLPTKE